MEKQQDPQWEPYDPSWLVVLAQEQQPEEEWLAQALANCISAQKPRPPYIYFVDSKNPNQPGSSWQFKRNILLQSPTEGLIALDILKGNRVGGVEFYERLKKVPSR